MDWEKMDYLHAGQQSLHPDQQRPYLGLLLQPHRTLQRKRDAPVYQRQNTARHQLKREKHPGSLENLCR